jgi:hypothetical protein
LEPSCAHQKHQFRAFREWYWEPFQDRLIAKHSVILIVRPELVALLVQQLGVCPEHGEGERVEHKGVLRVLGLAVRTR